MNNKKYVVATDAAEILSVKLSIPLGDLVDIFAEIPAATGFPKANEVSFGGSGFRLLTEKSTARFIWTSSETEKRSSFGRK